jgi:ABC-type antimicrobial peptide transport system permease subunit
MLKNRSILTLISLVLAIAYTIYILTYFAGVNAETTSDAEAVGAGIATLLVLPSVFVLGIGVILGLIGFFNRSTGLQLTAAILYSVAALLFLLYVMFLVPSIVLGFMGWNQQKKINAAAK